MDYQIHSQGWRDAEIDFDLAEDLGFNGSLRWTFTDGPVTIRDAMIRLMGELLAMRRQSGVYEHDGTTRPARQAHEDMELLRAITGERP